MLLAIGGALVAIGGVGLATVEDDEGVAAPTTTTSTLEITSTTTSAETSEAFLEVLATAIRSGDERTLFDRLHPAVLERFGAEACRVHLAAFEDPTVAFAVVSVSEPAVYAWTTTNQTTAVPDTLTVDVDVVRRGEASRAAIHLGQLGKRLSWFTDCGDQT